MNLDVSLLSFNSIRMSLEMYYRYVNLYGLNEKCPKMFASYNLMMTRHLFFNAFANFLKLFDKLSNS